ncbi:hypothetical protein ACFQ78_19695 [Streptomyces sp. NPDC056519]|uniref:hypothetical protein n=1 Tax=Streptomyces sp. NPDC056519 TaxID=3345849 RepID=UPI00368DED23
MGYVLLGHGGLVVDPAVLAPTPEWVAIPRQTTIRFYSDIGQGLLIGTDQFDGWEALQTFGEPLDSGSVTYNMTLTSMWEAWEGLLRNGPRFGGHTLVMPGINAPDPVRMCAGTPGTCPVTPRQVLESDARHHCDGILGQCSGDLYWVACTTIAGADPAVVEALLAGTKKNVALGRSPEWTPNALHHHVVDEANRAVLEHAADGEVLGFVLGGSTLVIGSGHSRDCLAYAENAIDAAAGQILVHRDGAPAGSGRLVVRGLPADRLDLAGAALARVSGLPVRFA